MSVSGKPVELIDGDLEHPALTTQLAPHSDAGLSEALIEPAGMSRLKTVQLTPSLEFLPAVGAGRTSEPNVYLGSPEMARLLSDRTASRDVVLDLPPLGTSSDAQAICALLDGVVLIVEAKRTKVEDALDALRVLRAANANVLGVVLNKSNPAGVRRGRTA